MIGCGVVVGVVDEEGDEEEEEEDVISGFTCKGTVFGVVSGVVGDGEIVCCGVITIGVVVFGVWIESDGGIETLGCADGEGEGDADGEGPRC